MPPTDEKQIGIVQVTKVHLADGQADSSKDTIDTSSHFTEEASAEEPSSAQLVLVLSGLWVQ